MPRDAAKGNGSGRNQGFGFWSVARGLPEDFNRLCGTLRKIDSVLAKHKDIVRHLRAGQSVRTTAAVTGKAASTVQRVKAALNPPDPIHE
jgi:hypothetical protein